MNKGRCSFLFTTSQRAVAEDAETRSVNIQQWELRKVRSARADGNYPKTLSWDGRVTLANPAAARKAKLAKKSRGRCVRCGIESHRSQWPRRRPSPRSEVACTRLSIAACLDQGESLFSEASPQPSQQTLGEGASSDCYLDPSHQLSSADEVRGSTWARRAALYSDVNGIGRCEQPSEKAILRCGRGNQVCAPSVISEPGFVAGSPWENESPRG